MSGGLGDGLGLPGQHKLRSSLRLHPGYNNPAFHTSQGNNLSVTKYQLNNNIKRSLAYLDKGY